jgi:quinol-cytochrome oxidoreductase complex cytochrome b subunit
MDNQTIESVPNSGPEHKQSFAYSKLYKILTGISVGMFVLSSSGGIVDAVLLTRGGSALVYMWYPAAVVSIMFLLVLFVVAASNNSENENISKTTFSEAFLFMVIVSLVGLGTCFANLTIGGAGGI